MEGKDITLGIVSEPSKVPFPTKIPDVNVCFHTFVSNSLPQWIVDTGATKHIV